MSSTSGTRLDFSTLKFSAPVLDKDEDSEEDQDPDYIDEHAFTKVSTRLTSLPHNWFFLKKWQEYIFTVADPNPPNRPDDKEVGTEEIQNPDDPSQIWRFPKFEYTPPPEPLVKIIVRTIQRKLIPPGSFYIYMDEYSDVR